MTRTAFAVPVIITMLDWALIPSPDLESGDYNSIVQNAAVVLAVLGACSGDESAAPSDAQAAAARTN